MSFNQPNAIVKQEEIVKLLEKLEKLVDDSELFTILKRIETYGIVVSHIKCGTCANRGKTDGLSQETHCDHCIYQDTWRRSHYVPIE